MSVLVVAEHDNNALAPVTFNTVTAARELGEVTVLVAGRGCRAVAEAAARIDGVSRVLLADSDKADHRLAENLAPLVADQAAGHQHLLAPATTAGKNLMPRVAALLGVAQISEISLIRGPDTFVRPIYAGNALATVRSADPVKAITVRGTAFEAAAPSGGNARIEEIPGAEDQGLSRLVAERPTRTDRPDLAAARVVVAGGRGMGSRENFRLLEEIADRLGAAVGASRAAVDAGFAPNDLQVGQTGRVVAPELYIAVGISGAIQHLAGMRDSKVIVAINKDDEAPIFQVADYGLVEDLFEALPALAAELDNRVFT